MQPVIFFYLTIICFLLALLFLYRRQFAAEIYCSGAGFVFSSLTLLSLLTAKKGVPVFGDFESLVFVTCILGGLLRICSPRRDSGTSARCWGYGFILLLLLYSLQYPKSPSPDQYNHHQIWIILFFVFRRVALAVMLFSSCFYIQYRKDIRRGIQLPIFSHMGRNYLLLGAICFLVSEYSGMIWCQKGWGDFWHWSIAFFLSTLVLLYLMTVFHISGKTGKADNARSLLGSLSGVLFLTMMMIRSLI